MTAGYSTLTDAQSQEDIRKMRDLTKRILATRDGARTYLIKAGILAEDGRQLAPQYRRP